MDFYTEQDSARRNTYWLLLAFVLAVILLIGITNVLVAMLLFFLGLHGLPVADGGSIQAFLAAFSWDNFAWISMGVVATVLLVILVKWAQLSAGGKVVAEGLGGTRILPATDDPAQRRCLNVVSEMALAAGLPVPPVYVLGNERGINAFAAGISPADAVIGITRGSLEHFNREQLQGVIGHEFSHILNGDMRINIRLAALLKGITFIGDLGEVLVRGGRHRGRSYSGSRKMPGQILFVGLALWLTGWLGGMFAGFIKAAISRQREYLADASAVQFTRNPQGVADALKVIGGYVPGTYVVAGRAGEMSHIFFGQVAWQLFSTHPPLDERIRRIDPGWNGQFIQVSREARYEGTTADQARQDAQRKRAAVVTGAVIAGAVLGDAAESAVRDAHLESQAQYDTDAEFIVGGIPAALARQANDPFSANALVFAILFAGDEPTQQIQLELIRATGIKGLAQTTAELAAQVRRLPMEQHLPLLELCLPALKCMSAPQYRQFKDCLMQLVRADQKIELHEWCLYQVLRHYLDPEFTRVTPSRPKHRKAVHVARHYATVVSVLAWHGHGREPERERAFTRAVQSVGLYNEKLRPLEECNVQVFSQAVHHLADCFPLLKPRLLKGMALCAEQDGILHPVETQVLTAVAAVMDCPLPELS